MVRAENQACSVAFEPVAQRFDLFCGSLLFRNEMVEAEHHQGVRIVEDARVDRELLPRLVDTLVHGDGMSRQLTDQLLEAEQRQMEQFEGPGDPLQK